MLELINRLEQASKPSRYDDCHLWVVAQGGDARMVVCDSSDKSFVWERGVDGFWLREIVDFRSVPKFTASLDAAIGLAEKVLPGHGRLTAKGRTRPDEPLYGAQIFDIEFATEINPPSTIGEAEHNVEAIALVIAVLRAIASTRSSNGGA